MLTQNDDVAFRLICSSSQKPEYLVSAQVFGASDDPFVLLSLSMFCSATAHPPSMLCWLSLYEHHGKAFSPLTKHMPSRYHLYRW